MSLTEPLPDNFSIKRHTAAAVIPSGTYRLVFVKVYGTMWGPVWGGHVAAELSRESQSK